MRTGDERGAVAVVVALLMVPLIGFVALAVDVGALYAKRVQLQNGADAAALAVASDCLRGACGTPEATARTFAAANLRGGTTTATISARTSSSVTVQSSTVHSYVFAPVLGVGSSRVSAEGTATWTGPTSGTALLPIAINLCEYQAATGGALPADTSARTLYRSRTSVSCPTAGGQGGFTYLDVNSTACRTTSAVGREVQIDPGNSVPSSCSSSSFANAVDTTILLPVFSSARGTGNNVFLTVHGFAAFHLTGYHLGSSYEHDAPCGGPDRCLRGYFTSLRERVPTFVYGSGAPQLGAGSVALSK